ncbi:hypothetical protein [Frisingicoccus sp.]|uniref:hypothetical protein n=1 Tax=Frisingicoccus sp. TaxID=1918627 RepID=UPI002A81473E|nr:hypothetical protein [Frisingicoccus sp.]MDY4923327.1 hypothetical protein [Frisingicoccus sp.]
MAGEITIIRIRRGLNGFPYAAYNNAGHFITNLDRLADARKHWKKEIELGLVKLVRELDKRTDAVLHQSGAPAGDFGRR